MILIVMWSIKWECFFVAKVWAFGNQFLTHLVTIECHNLSCASSHGGGVNKPSILLVPLNSTPPLNWPFVQDHYTKYCI